GEIRDAAGDQRPSAGRFRRPKGREPAEAWSRSGGRLRGTLPAQRPQRREGVVRDVAGPDEVPQRVEDLALVCGRARRRALDGPEERGALRREVLANCLVQGRRRPTGAVVGT